VKTIASAVVENKEYTEVPGTPGLTGINSNSAAFAIARGAGEFNEEAFRGVSNPGQAQSGEVEFDSSIICNGVDFKCQ
jgi:hypothetical protein